MKTKQTALAKVIDFIDTGSTKTFKRNTSENRREAKTSATKLTSVEATGSDCSGEARSHQR